MSTVPAGWEIGTDAKGRTYYVNHQTKATQWELPTAPALPPTPPPVYSIGPPAPAVVHATPVQAAPAPPAQQTVHQAPQPAPQQTVHQPPPQQVIYQPAVTHQPVVQVVERSAPASNGPPGAPAGGNWMPDKYVGPITIILGFVLVFPTCFIPCDSRMVYVVNGIKYDQTGAMVTGMC